MKKIKENHLFEMGWTRLGDDEEDPFYRFHSKEPVLGNHHLSGNYKPDGSFEIYGVPRVFNLAIEIEDWIIAVGFVEDKELTGRLRRSILRSRMDNQ